MSVLQENLDLRDNLEDLQVSSLRVMTLFVAIVIPVWFVWIAWPNATEPRPTSAWVGLGLLITAATLCYVLRRHYLRLALHLLVWGVLGAAACAVLAFASPVLTYLFIVPVVFASVLLTQPGFFLVALMAVSLALSAGSGFIGIPVPPKEMILPAAIIGVVTLSFWLSQRNLHTALAWVWSGYESARRNQEIARERAGELQRALKALDEATHRLERTNYMLALAYDQAEEARRLKQQFAQTISHELRTPLNLIVGFTELMIQSPEHYGRQLPHLYLRDLSIVHRNARHLQGLVNDVLDLARIDAVEMSLLPEEVNPAALVSETVDIARSLIEARGLALRTKVEPDLPMLWVDPVRIRQVLFNLLNNAARYTEQGSVTVSVCRQGEDVLFAVMDTGVGIAPQNIPRIFEEFQQTDSSTRRRQGGAGLGLAVSQRFVELHGGRIWVESQVGQGSTFYFRLPVCRTHVIAAAYAGSAETVQASSARRSEEPIVLVVTSSPSAAGLLTRYVHRCRTVTVPDLGQARETAQQLTPQAVVIDCACEGLGSAALESIARDWGLPHTSFLACPLPGEALLQQRLNVDAFLIKPVSRQGLLDVLRRFGEDVDRVLVIDDDDDFVRLLAQMLDSAIRRYQVIGAYSGQEGLTIVERRQPDLVLLDLVLPDMHGAQVVERLRSNPAWQDIPIVVITGQDEADVQQALRGDVTVARAEGLLPAEIVGWIQHLVDTIVTPHPAPSMPIPAPAQ
jgi:signal transduction histidine kinase/CheY-like chemotaxis protein